MGYSVLRVINDDVIAPGRGFGMHPHRDMEIVTYILEGALQHQDSMGNGSVIRAGDVQYMSAGSGVRHSEVNPSPDTPVHLLQIWLLPAQSNLTPQYGQKTISTEEKRGKWRVLASPDGHEKSMIIQQDACLFATMLDDDAPLSYPPRPGRRQYLHLARGTATLNDIPMRAGDGTFIENENLLTLSDAKAAEALLFDLP